MLTSERLVQFVARFTKLHQYTVTLNIFYCSKRQKDKTQVKQLRQSSPITYISKYTIEHNNI